jgi:hypothetical protein
MRRTRIVLGVSAMGFLLSRYERRLSIADEANACQNPDDRRVSVIEYSKTTKSLVSSTWQIVG